jgi:p-aminobenzoyl-glutamate transporter AbgT
MIITLFVYLLCLACWLGGMIFFSIFTAPVIFTALPIAEAGKVVSGIFPRYYILGYVAGIIGFILALYFAVSLAPRLWWSLAALALLIALVLTFYAGVVVRPRADAIRTVAEEQNPDPARKAEFQHLHRLAVNLNGAVMVLNLLALLSTAAALAPHA